MSDRTDVGDILDAVSFSVDGGRLAVDGLPVGDRVVLFDVVDVEREVPPPAFDRLMARWLRALGSLPTPPVADATGLADALDARAAATP